MGATAIRKVTPAAGRSHFVLKGWAMKFLVAETRAGSYSYHVRNAEFPERRAVCGDAVDVDTAIPIEAWEVRTDKSVITQWCKRCKIHIAATVAQAKLAALMPRGGDVVYFNQCRRELDGTMIGFKGIGFGVMLGAMAPGVPAFPPILVPRLMGEIGYLKFDDVIEFFGEELGNQCVEKFKDKYYGKIVAEGKPDVEGQAVASALQLVDGSGKPMRLLPGPKGEQ